MVGCVIEPDAYGEFAMPMANSPQVFERRNTRHLSRARPPRPGQMWKPPTDFPNQPVESLAGLSYGAAGCGKKANRIEPRFPKPKLAGSRPAGTAWGSFRQPRSTRRFPSAP